MKLEIEDYQDNLKIIKIENSKLYFINNKNTFASSLVSYLNNLTIFAI
jgi:hypothetical protein